MIVELYQHAAGEWVCTGAHADVLVQAGHDPLRHRRIAVNAAGSDSRSAPRPGPTLYQSRRLVGLFAFQRQMGGPGLPWACAPARQHQQAARTRGGRIEVDEDVARKRVGINPTHAGLTTEAVQRLGELVSGNPDPLRHMDPDAPGQLVHQACLGHGGGGHPTILGRSREVIERAA